ncbi:MAG TPA: 3-dehydroquinate synthase [Gemmatimonadaceae bacterium]|nr:3-dehydroquinate synthase [Gemmatimonadaceae bacterium]
MTVTTCRTLPYPVHVGHGLIDRLPDLVPELARVHRVAVVTDDVVGPLFAARIAAQLGEDRSILVSIPPGEEQKTRLTWARITDALLDAQFGRDSLLIALGGGVVGDLTGFVAATYLRGIPVLQVPTTLLAMVDASIGGKTGVDTVHGKNLVGAFHPPVAVLADLDTLATLPLHERVNGLAEALKHGVICDAAYFETVAATDLARADWLPLVARSVEIKTEVVASDEREQGRRKTLNYGHTIGHAIEQLMEYSVPHGACVAFGMLVEARIAIALGICDPALAPRLADVLERFGLPVTVPGILTPEAIVDATAGDKKSRAGAVEYALPARCGAMTGAGEGYGTRVPREVVIAALQPA